MTGDIEDTKGYKLDMYLNNKKYSVARIDIRSNNVVIVKYLDGAPRDLTILNNGIYSSYPQFKLLYNTPLPEKTLNMFKSLFFCGVEVSDIYSDLYTAKLDTEVYKKTDIYIYSPVYNSAGKLSLPTNGQPVYPFSNNFSCKITEYNSYTCKILFFDADSNIQTY